MPRKTTGATVYCDETEFASQIHRWLTELTPGKSITLIPPKGKSLPTNWANGLDAVSHEQDVGFALLYDRNDSGRRIIVVTKAKKEE